MSEMWTKRGWAVLPALALLLAVGTGCGGTASPPAEAQQQSQQGQAAQSALEAIKSRGVLRAGIRFDNPPHSFIDAQGNWVGFDVDISEAVAREMGLALEKVKVDQVTRISFLKSGNIDMVVASMSHTWKREQEVDFSQTYFWSIQSFLVKKGEATSLADLVGKQVGVDRGSHAIGNWRDWHARQGLAFDEALVVEFGDKQVAIQAVKQGSVAGYAQDYEVLASFAKADPSLAVLDDGIGMKQDGIAIRENDSKMLEAVNRALQAIAKSGEYDRIYDRWFGPGSDTPMPRAGSIEVWPEG